MGVQTSLAFKGDVDYAYLRNLDFFFCTEAPTGKFFEFLHIYLII